MPFVVIGLSQERLYQLLFRLKSGETVPFVVVV